MALKRKGFQKDVKLIANSTSEQCMAALQASAGQPGDLRNANLEALSNNEKISLELRTALRQVFLKDRFTCSLPASRSKIKTWKIKIRYEIWLRFENTMKIGFDSEMKAIYSYSTSKYVSLSNQMVVFLSFGKSGFSLVWPVGRYLHPQGVFQGVDQYQGCPTDRRLQTKFAT